MKMGPGLIFGVIIILVGLSILFKDFPFFRIIFGVLIILWGISVISGGFHRPWKKWNHDPNSVVFGESTYKAAGNEKEYNVVFGKSSYDFRDFVITDTTKFVELHTVFGSSDIIINKSTPVRILGNSAFGELKMPNGNSVAFGNLNYTNSAYKSDSACLSLKIDVVFGQVKIIEM